jgi:hypothetical protein
LSANIGSTSNALSVNSDFSEGNLEESVDTPGGVPGVSNNPVVGGSFLTPTNDLDGMTTEEGSRSVLIDTTLVVHEIFVDGESSFNRAVLDNVGLDSLGIGELDDGGLGGSISGGGLSISASREGVALGDSSVVRSIWPAGFSDESLSGNVQPGQRWVSTVASVVEGIARDEGLGSKDEVGGSVGGNAESVRKDFRSSESPA